MYAAMIDAATQNRCADEDFGIFTAAEYINR
jgi:hypothetical protein